MSLILEALRKLDREKQTPERGLVVTGATAWARAEPRRGARLALIALIGAALGTGAYLWRGRGTSAPAPAPGGATAVSPSATPPGAAAVAPDAEEWQLTAPAEHAGAADRAARGPATPAPGAAATPRPGDAARGAHLLGVAVAEAPGDDPAPSVPAGAADATLSEPGRARRDGLAQPAPPDEVILQAVTERDGLPIAIVNGRLVREGDSFDGIRILRILPSEVEIEIKGERRTVTF